MRLAIISDIHEDQRTLKKVLSKLKKRGYDRLICLGDIIGFSAQHYRHGRTRDASACLALIREHCDVVIPGNHDLHAAERIPLHSDVFDFPGDWYQLDLEERALRSENRLWLHGDDLDGKLSADERAYLHSLPEFQVLPAPEGHILLSHYAYPNLSGFHQSFYGREQDFRPHFDFMESQGCSLSFIGHAHPAGCCQVLPGLFRHLQYRRSVLNAYPTIIGVPPLTRNKHRGGFCTFDTSSRVLESGK